MPVCWGTGMMGTQPPAPPRVGRPKRDRVKQRRRRAGR